MGRLAQDGDAFTPTERTCLGKSTSEPGLTVSRDLGNSSPSDTVLRSGCPKYLGAFGLNPRNPDRHDKILCVGRLMLTSDSETLVWPSVNSLSRGV